MTITIQDPYFVYENGTVFSGCRLDGKWVSFKDIAPEKATLRQRIAKRWCESFWNDTPFGLNGWKVRYE